MQQLSGLDATFLFLETAEMPMHVGALHVFELPAGYPGRFATALRRHIAARLPVAPVLRRRLWWMPLNLANPAWVDAGPDLRLHIVEIRLAKGAGMAEMEAEVSRLHPVLLDRARPLWKMHVFEGLAPGPSGLRRVGLYTQLHHAAVDGQAAVALANALLDTGPQPRAVPSLPAGRAAVFKLGMSEMLRGVIGNQVQKVAQIVRGLPSTVGTLKDAAGQALSRSALLGGKAGSGNLSMAPRTPLNVSVSAGRAFATATLSLRELKQLGRAHDATINDIVLLVCAGALRRFYGRRKQLPRKSLIAAVPISLRAKGDTAADNQASMSLVNLGTNIADPKRRLAHVKAATAAMKNTMGPLKGILPTDFPSLGVPWLIEAATALYGRARAAERIPQLANLVISNVPGPPLPLYMAGARMLSNYPASIIVHGLALNITVQSYDQSLDFGLMADAAAMPDVKELASDLGTAFEDLLALPVPGEDAGDEPVSAAAALSRAARSIGGSLGDAVSSAVNSAVSGVVGKVTQGVVDATVKQVKSRALKSGGGTSGRAPHRR